jgi:RimJ/RimL family protein N-acetyltransferase
MKFDDKSIILESERLIFRKLTESDFNNLAEMLRDPEVMDAWEHTFSDEEIRGWLATQERRYSEDGVGYFAAIRKDNGEFIGQMGLLWSSFGEIRAPEIGYMLKRRYWGFGYAGEGAAALAQFAFSELGAGKVYTTIRPNNKRSVTVAGRIGMSVEGSYIKHYNGMEMEHTIYSMAKIAIRCANIADISVVTDLLAKVYDSHDYAELFAENERLLTDEAELILLAFDGAKPVGCAHSSIRREFVEGGFDDKSPVAYLEGIFVEAEFRKRGVARSLVAESARWAKERGCSAMASDCEIDNPDSLKFHLRIGFGEVSRNIYFIKKIDD